MADPTTFEIISDIVKGPDKLLHKKARGALITVARDILNEADPKPADWVFRSAWAERIINNPDAALPRVLIELSQVAGIRNDYALDAQTDAQVRNVITNNIWRIMRWTF